MAWLFWLNGDESEDYIFEVDTTAHKGPHACARRGRKGSKVADHDELVLMAMADAHSAIAHFRTVAAVEVKRVATLASRPYDDDGLG